MGSLEHWQPVHGDADKRWIVGSRQAGLARWPLRRESAFGILFCGVGVAEDRGTTRGLGRLLTVRSVGLLLGELLRLWLTGNEP